MLPLTQIIAGVYNAEKKITKSTQASTDNPTLYNRQPKQNRKGNNDNNVEIKIVFKSNSCRQKLKERKNQSTLTNPKSTKKSPNSVPKTKKKNTPKQKLKQKQKKKQQQQKQKIAV